MKRATAWALLVLILLAAACESSTPFQSPVPAPVFDSPVATPTFDSPLEVNALPLGPAFAFSEPVEAGDTVIAGTGGPNVPIRIISISDAGDIVASGQVGSDGKFSFSPKFQLIAGTRLGIVLGEVGGTNLKSEDFLRGPNYSDLPYVGTVFAQTIVQ